MTAAAEQAQVREQRERDEQPAQRRYVSPCAQGVRGEGEHERGERQKEEAEQRPNPAVKRAQEVTVSEQPHEHEHDAWKRDGKTSEKARHPLNLHPRHTGTHCARMS